MSKNYTVSILVPVYNVKNYILRCLDSIGCQTSDADMECIIVDDCGNDGSVTLVNNFIGTYNGKVSFRIIHHEYNRGLAAARNTAVENAKGDFVMHVDSDDWIEPNAVEVLLNEQIKTGADIVSGNALQHNKNSDIILREPFYTTAREMAFCMIEMKLDHVVWRRLIKKRLYLDNKIHAVEGVNIGEDHQIMPKLAYFAAKVAVVDKIVYHYNCMNNNSYTTQNKRLSFNVTRYYNDRDSILIIKDFFEGLDPEIFERISEIQSHYLKKSAIKAAGFSSFSFYRTIRKDSGKNYSVIKDRLCYHCDMIKCYYKMLICYTKKIISKIISLSL